MPNTQKLFKIFILHAGPKSQHTAIETYLIARNEEEVFNWIDTKTLGRWTEQAGEERWDETNNTKITFKECVMQNRGDLNDGAGWEDSYYGVKKWGWELVEASETDIATLLRLGIAVEAPTSP